MLISAVLPIMSLYRLPHGQYGYSGNVINLPQDVACFVHSLPRLPSDVDVIVVRKEGAAQSHRDFRVRRSVVLGALQWLIENNKYYRSVTIDSDALALLPEDGDISRLCAVTLDTPDEDQSIVNLQTCINIGLCPMCRYHKYFEPAGEAQGIKRAVKLTTEGVNGFRPGYE